MKKAETKIGQKVMIKQSSIYLWQAPNVIGAIEQIGSNGDFVLVKFVNGYRNEYPPSELLAVESEANAKVSTSLVAMLDGINLHSLVGIGNGKDI